MPPLYRLLHFRPDGDGAGGTPATPAATPPPATTPGQGATPAAQSAATPPADSGNGGEPAWLPDRLKRAEASAIKGLLEKLGFEKPEDLESLVTDAKKRADGEKTDLQKAQDALAKAQKDIQTQKERADALEAARIADKVGAALIKIASDGKLKAQYPDHISEHIQTKMAEQFSGLWKDGKVDEKEAEKLVEAVKKAYPGWFMSGGPGSPSNARGLVPEPGEQAKKELASKKLFKL